MLNSILNCGHDAIAAATLSTEFSGRIAVRTASSSQRFLSATLTAVKNQYTYRVLTKILHGTNQLYFDLYK